MSIRYSVRPLLQSTRMSCWWTCMRMVIHYQKDHDYVHPRDYHRFFSGSRTDEQHWHRPQQPGVLLRRRIDWSCGENNDAPCYASDYIEPFQWYENGLPLYPRPIRDMCMATNFRAVSRPAFGAWTGVDFETRLRRLGPFIFFGNWEGAPHAITVIGVVKSEGSQDITIIANDPAEGFSNFIALDQFNQQMSRRYNSYTLDGLNPIAFSSNQSERTPEVDISGDI